jgi:ferrous-iron efflux pump FieF
MVDVQADRLQSLRDKERSVRAAFLLGVVTFFPDLAAVLLGNSTTILAGFVKTTSETLATLLAWLSLRKIARGKTDLYNYGYGKLENLSSLVVAGVMMLSFAVVVSQAWARFVRPEPVGQVWLGLLISTVAYSCNFYFWRRNYALARKEPSPIMESQWRLYRIKSIANLCTILALGGSVLLRGQPWSVYIDPIGSLILSGFLLASAYRVAASSVGDLLDHTLDETLQFVILQELTAHFDDYERFHGVRSRRSGGDVYIEIFLEFDGNRKMGEVQQVIDQLKSDLEAKIQNSRVSIVPTTAGAG